MIILTIGNSNSNLKTFNCSKNIKKEVNYISKCNWASLDEYNDTFHVSIDNGRCLVRRTDNEGGWGMNLKIYVETYNTNITISMTTLPNRLESNHFKNVYNSLLNQKTPFYKLIINLECETFCYKIPDYLLFNKNIVFNNTSYKGPCCKLLGSINILKENDIVIVMDDDIIMNDNFISVLYNSFLKNTNAITANFTRKLVSKKGINIMEARGFGGFIFKMSNKYKSLELLYKDMPECARKIDDTWFASCFVILNIPVIQQHLCTDIWNNILNMVATNKHPNWLELHTVGDRQELETEFMNSF